MAYRDLQVHIDSGDDHNKHLHAASVLASRLEAYLTGVYVRPPFQLPSYIAPMSVDWLNKIEMGHEQAINTNEREAQQAFEDITSRYQVDTMRQSVTGDVYTALATEAGYTDMLVLEQTEPDDEKNKHPDLPDRLVLTAGCPCLVIPYIGADENFGKHPLVAWNGSRESNRALHDALPLLEKAETVTIMLAETEHDAADMDLPDTRIARHLARHSVEVMTKTLRADKRQTSNAFLSYLADNGHDLLVMGAYGHSRFREIVLGGMTREIMRSMTVPVLMSH